MRKLRLLALTGLVGLAAGTGMDAAVLEVDAGAACPGAGTPAAPFCTIGLAAAAAAPGDTVNVAPGAYREQVTPPASGAAGLPITYRATSPGARVLGTESLSAPGLWSQATATAWSTPFAPATNTRQVFVDGERLAEVASVGALVTDSFFFDAAADVLYVDIGGANPGTRSVEAGARSFGFDVSGRSFVVVEGFEISGQNNSAVRVRAASDVAIRDNEAARARAFGILVEGTASPLVTTSRVEVSGNEVAEIDGDGIRLRIHVDDAEVRGNVSHHNRGHGIFGTETTDSTISGNELHDNVNPDGVSTTGMLLDAGAHGNLVERNLAYANQDTGFQVTGGVLNGTLIRNQDNVLVRNISHSNGDHGFDNRESDGTRLISNTAWGNANDGFSIEGNAAGITLANNIGASNGILSGGNNLFVDTGSTTGFSADYDVWWNEAGATAHSIEFAGVEYDTIAAFQAATGQEAHGSDLDPRLEDPADGDFHPGADGSAIDSANAAVAGFQALDFDGLPPLDLPDVPNTGAGVPDFADRGALEYQDDAPSARLRVDPRRIAPGESTTADASGSSDDIGIVSYRFDWGDGSVTTQAGPIATHQYTSAGVHHVRLTVTDGSGQTATAQQPVQVRAPKGKPGKNAKATKPAKAPKAEKTAKPKKGGKR